MMELVPHKRVRRVGKFKTEEERKEAAKKAQREYRERNRARENARALKAYHDKGDVAKEKNRQHQASTRRRRVARTGTIHAFYSEPRTIREWVMRLNRLCKRGRWAYSHKKRLLEVEVADANDAYETWFESLDFGESLC